MKTRGGGGCGGLGEVGIEVYAFVICDFFLGFLERRAQGKGWVRRGWSSLLGLWKWWFFGVVVVEGVGCGMARDGDEDGDFWGVGKEQRKRGGGEKGEMGRERAWWGVVWC